jgi:hypothetical protein
VQERTRPPGYYEVESYVFNELVMEKIDGFVQELSKADFVSFPKNSAQEPF